MDGREVYHTGVNVSRHSPRIHARPGRTSSSHQEAWGRVVLDSTWKGLCIPSKVAYARNSSNFPNPSSRHCLSHVRIRHPARLPLQHEVHSRYSLDNDKPHPRQLRPHCSPRPEHPPFQRNTTTTENRETTVVCPCPAVQSSARDSTER